MTQETLQEFRSWLLRRGRSDETARCYVGWLKKCSETRGLTDRLIDRKLSPKTRRANMAALQQWAKFAKDGDLVADLDDIRLPPPIRVTPKAELEMHEWRDMIAGTRKVAMKEPVRQVILIIEMRGMRLGDVLRLDREKVTRAVATGTLSYVGKGERIIEYDAAQIAGPLAELAKMMKQERVDRVRDLIGHPDSSDRAINLTIARALKKVAKKKGVKGVHPHRMRRTYATAFVKRLGNDPRAMIKLQKHMGWTNVNTAAQYVDNVQMGDLDQMGADLMKDVLKGDV